MADTAGVRSLWWEPDVVTGAMGRSHAQPVTQLRGLTTMAEYVLPDLAYDYGALEPHISAEIMELHHSKHHATYVKGANDALEQLAAAREDGTISTKAPLLSKNLAFHLGGHTNHSVFWQNMSPDGGDKPEGELASAIDAEFGSFDKFQAHFNAAATTLQGSGWAVLGWDHIGQRLIIQQLTDQQGNISINMTPLLMLDMWEHAFYLQYKNVKPDYVKAWWNVVNWADVAERYAAAKS
ncbi:superoxide dismutase [Dietzia cercidiphylli]